MNWNYLFTGIALLGLGLAVVLAPLPPQWWPSMYKPLINAAYIIGLVLCIVGVVFIWGGLSPVFNDRSLWPQTGMILASIGFIICTIWWLVGPSDESLPGAGFYAHLRIYDTPQLYQKVILDATSPDSESEMKFFLSKGDHFSFAVSDLSGVPYTLDIPLGQDGIPIDRFIFLFCDVGLEEKSTILRAFVDEKEVARRVVPIKLNIGKPAWRTKTIGADANGQNGAPIKITEWIVHYNTLTEKSRAEIIRGYKAAVNAAQGAK